MVFRQNLTLPIVVLALVLSIQAQSSGLVPKDWKVSKRVVPVTQGHVRLVLTNLSTDTDWIVGIEAKDVPQASVSVSEAHSEPVPALPVRKVANVLDWPAQHIRVQPGMVEVSRVSAASGSVMIHLSVPLGTEVTIDTDHGTILSGKPANSFLVRNGLAFSEEVKGLASLLLRLMLPPGSTPQRNAPEVVRGRDGQYIASVKGLSSHLLAFRKPNVNAADGTRANLRVRINEFGDVIEIIRVSGDETFLNDCEQAVRQWKFRPFSIDGKRVPVIGSVFFAVHGDKLWSPVLQEQK